MASTWYAQTESGLLAAKFISIIATASLFLSHDGFYSAFGSAQSESYLQLE
jgi:hypothetical protein